MAMGMTAILGGFIIAAASPSGSLLAGAAILGASGVSVLLIATRLRGFPFDPVTIVALSMCAFYALPLLTMAPSQSSVLEVLGVAPSPESLRTANMVSVIGAITALAGASWGAITSTRSRLKRPSVIRVRKGRRRLFAAAAAVATIGWLVLIGGPGAALNALSDRLVEFSGRAVLLVGPYVFASLTLARLAVGASTSKVQERLSILAVVVVLVLTGSKAVLAVFLIAAVVLISTRSKRRLSVRKFVILGSALVAMLTMFNLYFRAALPQGKTIEEVVADHGGLWEATGETFIRNSFFGPQMLAVIVDTFPDQQDFFYGRTLLPLSTAFVPRLIYAEKPDSPAGLITGIVAPELYESGSAWTARRGYLSIQYPGRVCSISLEVKPSAPFCCFLRSWFQE
jgi:hypothetical protein